jgi:hypothetical protein
MQLPRIFYGRFREVKPRLMRVAKRAARGEDWVGLVEHDGFIEVADTEGFIVGDGPSSLLGGGEHFQMWFLWDRLWQVEPKPSAEIKEAFFQESLAHSWSVLGLMMRVNHFWFIREEHHAPFLRAVSRYWLDFGAVGPRYSNGNNQGMTLWDVVTMVKHLFANHGLPLEFLQAPCAPGAFARLLDEHGIAPG